ncbi:MAG: hypothetical protein JXO22_08455 [Phycisphaerae bacterium]|nr:hypothetical protein [Phycisphaerae bacterium]
MSRPPRSVLPTILHQDDDVLVVDKPAGLTVRRDRGEIPCVLDELSTAVADTFEVVGDLDSEASGVVAFVATGEGRDDLLKQLEERRAERCLLALVTGYVESEGEINLPLRFDGRIQHVSHRRGKPARTRYKLRQRVAGNTLLECWPMTDNRQQVRAHLAAIGHPLTVDRSYGGGGAVLLSTYKGDYRPKKDRDERPLISRLTLHASHVSFLHPVTQTPMSFEVPPPRDLRAVLNQLSRL